MGRASNDGKLVVLGIGVGMVAYSLPRDVWNILPGGVPYVIIDTKDSPCFKNSPCFKIGRLPEERGINE